MPDASSATSIAVLPFTNLTGDPEDTFVDGFVVELHNSLSQIADLRVSALSSSMAFRDSGKDLRDFAVELGVDYLLEGRVKGSLV